MVFANSTWSEFENKVWFISSILVRTEYVWVSGLNILFDLLKSDDKIFIESMVFSNSISLFSINSIERSYNFLFSFMLFSRISFIMFSRIKLFKFLFFPEYDISYVELDLAHQILQ